MSISKKPEELDPETLKKWREESLLHEENYRYRDNLFKSILVSSVSEDKPRLPTIEEFILSEVVNATIEYIGGNAGQIDYQKFKKSNVRHTLYEWEINDYLEKEIKAHSEGKLHPRVKESIAKLCERYTVYPYPERPYHRTELYDVFKGPFSGGRICQVIMRSSFSLPQETIIEVQKKIIPSLSGQEKKDIQGIGKAMRKYIDKDLEYIAHTYYW